MKLIELLSFLPNYEDTKYYIVKFNDKVLVGKEEIEEHHLDYIQSIIPEHNSYNNRSYILITLQPNSYYGL